MKSTRVLSHFLAALVLAGAGISFAGTSLVHVSASGDDLLGDGTEGNPYQTIQKGIDAVDSGGVVLVTAGRYEPATTIVIDKAVSLLGPQADVDPRPFSTLGSSDTTKATDRIPGDDATEAVVDGGNGGFPLDGIFSIQADEVTINGFCVQTSNGDMVQSPLESTQSGAVISYNILRNSFTDDAVQLRSTTDAIIEFNYINNTAQDAISVCCASTGAWIRFNEIANNNSENAAIYIYDDDPTDRDLQHVIEGNRIYNVFGDDAIELGAKNGGDVGDTGILVEGNDIGRVPSVVKTEGGPAGNIKDDGIEVHVSGVRIIGNIFAGVTGDSGPGLYDGAVSIEDETRDVCVIGNLFSGNLLIEPTAAALSIDTAAAADTITIERNTFVNNSPSAIASRTVLPVAIRNNTFVENAQAIRVTTNNDFLVEGNRFWGSTAHLAAYGQFAALVFSGNEVYSGDVYTSTGVFAVPAPVILGNYYGDLFDFDFDGNGLINGLSIPSGPPAALQIIDDVAVVAQLDRDVDGLSDAFELYGSFPYNFKLLDTDNDGIPDGADRLLCTSEVSTRGTFDLNADADGDGYVDFYEDNRGTRSFNRADFPSIGDLDRNGFVSLSDAVIALQLINGAVNYDIVQYDLNGINVTGMGPRSLSNALQILRFQAGVRVAMPAIPGID